jgi:cytochrome P450
MKDQSAPKGHWLLGHWWPMSQDPLNFFSTCAAKYGDIVPLRLGPRRVLFLNHPDCIEKAFSHQNRVFARKSPSFRKTSRLLLGNGLFLSEGKFYQRQRELVQPAFHQQMLNAYSEVMVAEANCAIAQWQDGQQRDVYQDFVNITRSIIAKTMLGTGLEAEKGDQVTIALDALMNHFQTNLKTLLLVPDWLPTPENLHFRNTVKQLEQVVYSTIAHRAQNEETQNNFLDLLLLAQQKGDLSPQQLRDEVINIFLAGHETTAIALTWIAFLLERHPLVESKLVEELQTSLGGRMPTAYDLPNLRYTEAFALEALRLYPPVGIMGREALENTQIAGYPVPKGTIVLACQWTAHRNPTYFPEPERFNPSRWENGLAKRLPPGTYFPFSLGARSCLGKAFGMMELILVLATVVQKFQFKLAPEHPVEISPRLTLRPKYGMKMRVMRR